MKKRVLKKRTTTENTEKVKTAKVKVTKADNTPTKENTPVTLPRWKYVGRGVFLINGKKCNNGDKVEANVSDIPETMRDLFISLDEKPKEKQNGRPVTKRRKGEPTLERMKGGTYNVFDAEGNQVNDEPLTRGQAVELFEGLTI